MANGPSKQSSCWAILPVPGWLQGIQWSSAIATTVLVTDTGMLKVLVSGIVLVATRKTGMGGQV